MENADIYFPNLGIYIKELPKNISIGGFSIAFYGMIIALGMIAGISLACFIAKKTKQNPGDYMDYALYGIVLSVIGARLYYVIFRWDYYSENLLQIFNFRAGGLAIYGGVIVAIITVFVFTKIKKMNFFLFADTAICGLILGQIIGRYGNFFNRECFGEYTDSLFAMRLNLSQVDPTTVTETMKAHITKVGDASFIQVHPTFLYESTLNLIVLIIMLIVTKKKKFDGHVLITYIFGYGIVRFIVEGLRTDQLKLWNTDIAVSQLLSAVLVVAAVVFYILRRKSALKAQDTETEEGGE